LCVLIDITTFSTTDWQRFLTGTGYTTTEAMAILTALHPAVVTPATLRRLLALMHAQACLPWAVGQHALPVGLLDCCGTGGSGRANFNTSTTVAFILAAGGVPVLKFGNRAASSPSGSFDFLEGLGLPLPQLSAHSLASVEATGLGFLFAPDVYPALKPLALWRKQFGQPTVFNFLGPLLNPLQPEYRLLGCSHAGLLPLLAEELALQPTCNRALVLRSESGLDEAVATEMATGVWIEQKPEVGTTVQPWEWHPTVTPINGVEPVEMLDFSVANNVAWFKQLIGVEPKTSLPRSVENTVILNAGLGFWVANKVNSVEAGIQLATDLLIQGRVRQQYQSVVTFHRKLLV